MNFATPSEGFFLAFVALENIFRPRYTHWRLLVVLVFGLIHGPGFASALKDLELPRNSLAIGLVGFNVGVEGGQLAAITAAFLLTGRLRNAVQYRRWTSSPAPSPSRCAAVDHPADRVEVTRALRLAHRHENSGPSTPAQTDSTPP